MEGEWICAQRGEGVEGLCAQRGDGVEGLGGEEERETEVMLYK